MDENQVVGNPYSGNSEDTVNSYTGGTENTFVEPGQDYFSSSYQSDVDHAETSYDDPSISSMDDLSQLGEDLYGMDTQSSLDQPESKLSLKASETPMSQPNQDPLGQSIIGEYGQPTSPYGQQTQSPYGQPTSPYGQTAKSPYGQPGQDAYGQPTSPYGQPAQNPYGQSTYGSYGQTSQNSYNSYGQAARSPYPAAGNQYNPGVTSYGSDEEPAEGLAIGGFVCSIVSIFFGIIVAIVGLILSKKAINEGNKGAMAKAGEVISIIVIILNVIAIIGFVILFSTAMSNLY